MRYVILDFSVLMSIYHKEQPEYFDRAMRSIWDEQTEKPNEIVLVQDGPLSLDMYKRIDEWQRRLGEAFHAIRLDVNMGLGYALSIGLDKCKNELVARMDTDDISCPDRFYEQLHVFAEMDVDVCGSWVGEFVSNEDEITAIRRVPERHEEIVRFAKKRSPCNHPSVMYRKSAVLSAGGYKTMLLFEDYYLWARMLLNGAKFYNVQKPLVKMRTGNQQIARRRGVAYLRREIVFFLHLRKIGFITLAELFQNVAIRSLVRIAPVNLVRVIYRFLREGY